MEYDQNYQAHLMPPAGDTAVAELDGRPEPPAPPLPIDSPYTVRIEGLEQQVTDLEGQVRYANDQVAGAVGRLASFKQMVRETVIEKIKDGTICKAGSNEVLDQWGLEEYQPRFRVGLNVYVEVTLIAEDEDDAGRMASSSITVEHDDDVDDIYVHDITVDTAEELDE